MKYEVLQSTKYTYSRPVSQSINKCVFKPLSNSNQNLILYEQIINPNATGSEYLDYWGNEVSTFYVWEPHDFLEVQTRSVLEISYEPVNVIITLDIEKEMKSNAFKKRYAEFLCHTEYSILHDHMIEEVLKKVGRDQLDLYHFVEKVNQYIYNHFSYVPGATHVKTVASEAFEMKTGVCQDFTHIMLAICRSQGIPSRYVSGYIYNGEDAAMRGDAVTHAWVEVYFPTYGWIGFDPTNDMLALDYHICVATGRDYADITPMKGVYMGNASHEMNVSIRVSAVESEKIF
ncbi:transglutaminase family protein [Bacillus sp. 03113]|uniref:transglutaminase family protein n=1 Tax=Bacillus sp. 03113 TaxID=2578211 RepID=UPI001144FD9F|nr:transglutaminase family protein [Bacillus sp. 03113]